MTNYVILYTRGPQIVFPRRPARANFFHFGRPLKFNFYKLIPVFFYSLHGTAYLNSLYYVYGARFF